MDVLNPIYTEKTVCQDCYKCVRHCTVKAIRVENGRAAVLRDLCILCGHCVEVCPAGAKKVRNDLGRARKLLESGKRVIASLAPSFASEFPGIDLDRMASALVHLGFWAVSETAWGADLVAKEVALQLSQAQGGSILMSSACPTVVDFIAKYRPAFADRITSLASPLLSQARMLRRLYGDDCAVVFIGPCISKKQEADEQGQDVAVAIDFEDLRTWLSEANIHLPLVKASPDVRIIPERAGKGALYPVDGGMIAAIKSWQVTEGVRFMSFSGIEEIARALDDVEDALSKGRLKEPLFLELLACPGGCINGPRSKKRTGTINKRLSVLDYGQNRSAGDLVKTLEGHGPVLAQRWTGRAVAAESCSEQELAEALRRTGKYSREDELNCGGCGYDTCRDFARAMLAGRAEADMCVSYMRKLAQKKANGLIRAIPSGVVIVDARLAIVECNYNFARLLGEEALQLWEAKPGLEGAALEKLLPFSRYFQDVLNGAEAIDRDIRFNNRILHGTIFGIERGAYAGGVFQDVTDPWVQKDRIVSQARKVITRNLAVVQKIAFLLGENAAETEATLNSIIESFEHTGSSRSGGEVQP
ncbi:[Fe-Fe] hydrogenase large subunit C-terminal domain-containing protein [Gracilinema caldarium]|uniref:[Fe-Fe] hydrogenase large subunit C-terminal domain-containing protein n=1 Tax=Gracilinema caldarium TaxID=215591 RepID=UPI0026E971D2|nr:[Fe-Fe] hydrogenase large subunit C-terminal domain-containing protein [Gracilinema caldarium]